MKDSPVSNTPEDSPRWGLRLFGFGRQRKAEAAQEIVGDTHLAVSNTCIAIECPRIVWGNQAIV